MYMHRCSSLVCGTGQRCSCSIIKPGGAAGPYRRGDSLSVQHHIPIWLASLSVCGCVVLPAVLPIGYPLQWFVVVVAKHTASGHNAIAYQLKHMLEFPQDKVGEHCCSPSLLRRKLPG